MKNTHQPRDFNHVTCTVTCGKGRPRAGEDQRKTTTKQKGRTLAQTTNQNAKRKTAFNSAAVLVVVAEFSSSSVHHQNKNKQTGPR